MTLVLTDVNVRSSRRGTRERRAQSYREFVADEVGMNYYRQALLASRSRRDCK